jgi:GntR family transcriptional regulator/MocR family aminotransferase
MAVQWSGWGPELLLRLDRGLGQPLRSQLETGIREAVRTGRLQGGERLPSSRELARQLGISRGLVQECYQQLLAEGYLTSQAGSATRVAATARPVPAASRPPEPARPARLIADFRAGVPDLASFPREDWVWATREACRRVATAELDYGDPRGSAELRQVVAGYLRRVRAAAADPGQIIICTGFAQGLGLVLRVLAQLGVASAALEDPGHGAGPGRRSGAGRRRARRGRRAGRRRDPRASVADRRRARGGATARAGGVGGRPGRVHHRR